MVNSAFGTHFFAAGSGPSAGMRKSISVSAVRNLIPIRFPKLDPDPGEKICVDPDAVKSIGCGNWGLIFQAPGRVEGSYDKCPGMGVHLSSVIISNTLLL
jgi:hypothetical protein